MCQESPRNNYLNLKSICCGSLSSDLLVLSSSIVFLLCWLPLRSPEIRISHKTFKSPGLAFSKFLTRWCHLWNVIKVWKKVHWGTRFNSANGQWCKSGLSNFAAKRQSDYSMLLNVVDETFWPNSNGLGFGNFFVKLKSCALAKFSPIIIDAKAKS